MGSRRYPRSMSPPLSITIKSRPTLWPLILINTLVMSFYNTPDIAVVAGICCCFRRNLRRYRH